MNDHAHIEEFEQRIRTIASLAKTHRETYDAWLDMLDERNKTSHTYRESMAQEVFDELPRYLAPLQALHTSLVSRLNEIEAAPSGA